MALIDEPGRLGYRAVVDDPGAFLKGAAGDDSGCQGHPQGGVIKAPSMGAVATTYGTSPQGLALKLLTSGGLRWGPTSDGATAPPGDAR